MSLQNNIKLQAKRHIYFFLRDYKGIEFLKESYEAEHTIGIDDAIDDIKQVCTNNGGYIK